MSEPSASDLKAASGEERPTIKLSEANLRALKLGYPVVTSDAIIVLDKPVRRG